MNKVLLIAEKDSLGLQIAKALGVSKKCQDNGVTYFENETTIVAMASGHLVQRIPAENSQDLPFLPSHYTLEPIKPKIKKLMTIKKLANRPDVGEICNACDPGREGELIGYLIYAFTNCRKKYTRLWADTQTPAAIRKDFTARKPAEHYKPLLKSALARHDADFKLGINTTRCLQILMRKLNGNHQLFSAGRVRTPTMAKIYDLEQKIQTFKPVTYYELLATLEDNAGHKILAHWIDPGSEPTEFNAAPEAASDDAETDSGELPPKLLEIAAAEKIKSECEAQPVRIDPDVTDKITTENPPDLFDITDLILASNNQFKWPVSEVTDCLQVLYENGLVTYPRSESKFLGEDAVEDTRAKLAWLAAHGFPSANQVLEHEWSESAVAVFNTGKLVDGHGAIVPEIPGEGVSISNFTESQQQLYQLIVDRFVQKFYPPARYKVLTYTFVINGHQFRATYKTCIDSGWRTLKPSLEHQDPDPEINLETAILSNIEIITKQTTPPKRLTIGQIPKMMKRFHLGTAATRGSIISELMAKSDKEKRRIQFLLTKNNTVYPSSENGQVIEFLREHQIADLTHHEMTAKLEQDLEAIAKGRLAVDVFTATVDREVTRIVRQFQNYLDQLPEFKQEVGTCPKCHSPLFDTGTKAISCSCGFKLWKMAWGVSLTTTDMEALLNHPHQTRVIKGFVSQKTRKKFETALRLDPNDDWKLVPAFATQSSALEASLQETEYQCPHCQRQLRLNVISDTNKQLVCPSSEHKFALRLFIAQRKLSGDEVKELLTTRYLSSRKGYVGKSGKEFSTALKLLDDGGVEFSFSD